MGFNICTPCVVDAAVCAVLQEPLLFWNPDVLAWPSVVDSTITDRISGNEDGMHLSLF
jgi:hypothetical protein